MRRTSGRRREGKDAGKECAKADSRTRRSVAAQQPYAGGGRGRGGGDHGYAAITGSATTGCSYPLEAEIVVLERKERGRLQRHRATQAPRKRTPYISRLRKLFILR